MAREHQPTQKILILEDQQDLRELLTDWLITLDYQVSAFDQTDHIIHLATQTNPDLVILDYILDGINGGEYCHQLKHHPQTRDIPVLMLSAHQRVIDSLGHYGWDAFVAKPFDLDDLGHQIRTLLESKATP